MGYYSNLSTGGTVGQEADPFRPLRAVESLPAQAPSRAQRRGAYWSGFDAYCKGLSLADLSDRDEIRGWWAANAAAGEADYVAKENY